MNIQRIKKAAEIARGRTTDKRWIAAIDKAVAGVDNGWIVTELAHGVAVTTESGETYFANGSCQCKAFALGTPCKHRALARLMEIASEIEEVATPATSPEEIERSITATWSQKFPTDSLADALMACFGQNSFKFMPVALMRDILAAIA